MNFGVSATINMRAEILDWLLVRRLLQDGDLNAYVVRLLSLLRLWQSRLAKAADFGAANKEEAPSLQGEFSSSDPWPWRPMPIGLVLHTHLLWLYAITLIPSIHACKTDAAGYVYACPYAIQHLACVTCSFNVS
jgi:hypothetical protein